MKNNILPKSLVLKKISPTERVYVQGNLASNGHWLIDTQWLLSLKSKDLGLTKFRNAINRALANAVECRLSGDLYYTRDLKSIVDVIPMLEYKEAKSPEYHKGFVRGVSTNFDAVALRVTKGLWLDIEYAALCFLDDTLTLKYKDGKSPVVLINTENKIVAVIMPLNPTKIKDFLQRKGR